NDGNPVWPEKYTREHWDKMRSVKGDYIFQTEYMNNPQVEGNIFKDGDIQWSDLPRITSYDYIVGHWDVAYSGSKQSDFNAVKIWGLKNGNFYHIKAFVR